MQIGQLPRGSVARVVQARVDDLPCETLVATFAGGRQYALLPFQPAADVPACSQADLLVIAAGLADTDLVAIASQPANTTARGDVTELFGQFRQAQRGLADRGIVPA